MFSLNYLYYPVYKNDIHDFMFFFIEYNNLNNNTIKAFIETRILFCRERWRL